MGWNKWWITRTNNVSNQIKFKTSIIRLNLKDYRDAYIHVKYVNVTYIHIITVANTGTAAAINNTNKKVIFKNCAPFINCINEINNIQVDDAHDTDVVMPIYNLIAARQGGFIVPYVWNVT